MSPLSRVQIRQEIAKLNRLDPKHALYSAIGSTYEKIMERLAVVVGMTGGGELFYRVRRTNGHKPTCVSDLMAPPAELVTGYQRCNPPGIPMFYAASKRIGALIEARVEAKEIVYLSQWMGHEKMPVNRIFDTPENQIVPGANMATISGPNDDIVLTYLDTQFTKRIHSTFADDYKFTSAIAQQLTTKFPPNSQHDIHDDGYIALKYPSVFTLEGLHNTAMHSKFAEKRLNLLHVMELKIAQVSGNDISVEVLDTAINFPNGKIDWSGNQNLVPVLSEGRGVYFKFDGEKWNLDIHEASITPEYIKLLLND